ncbi:IS6 family transposase [Streptomyces atratus]|uniref:IS6 family transposase n=1 Tax=Streptomyces atratus TaxID=1893 RepID=UPI00386B2D27
MGSASPSYKGHRYVEIISHCVWLYFRFPLSFREVEELMLERGVIVSHETVRRWCAKFGQAYANGLRRRRPRPGDKWHLDEVFIKINGEQKYLWRAVDADGNVLDILVQNRRDTAAARRVFRRLLKTTCSVPRVVVTDKLRSYGAAHREVMLGPDHRRCKPAHHGLTTGPDRGPHQATTHRQAPATQQRDSTHTTSPSSTTAASFWPSGTSPTTRSATRSCWTCSPSTATPRRPRSRSRSRPLADCWSQC